MVQLLWKITRGFLKRLKNRTTIWFNNPTSGYVSKTFESKGWKRYLHIHVHSIHIHNSQEVEATCPPTVEWINKCVRNIWWNTIQPWKKGDSDICYTMNELGRHYAMWKKNPITKRQTLHDSTYMKYLK